ncbi:presenilin family intramembrane aspartyl protease PSH [Haloarchaeobius sp. HME9146]|uniref:presenilin family intramembrane aspartyl protease PSH n=1 Tax=Haloarchaeobius sp. HME9146 TaxID=2978732 RepID=UPI0021BEB32F|nr:presenilin family intramembrane aspartyl protease PSH [Haloarchaeobius sp. HME9146]MCT9096501.1 presenilin family intramembrane aspartyl protease [Haloarchaeobius sp. HME9146]
MNDRYRIFGAVGLAVTIFVLVQLGALSLVEPFKEGGRQVVENPQDATNSIVYIGAILVATAGMLAAFKFDLQWLIRGFIILTSGMLSYYVFETFMPTTVAVAAGGVVALGLLVYPEWYVIDTAGVVMGSAAAGLFGISFGLFPAIVLLTILAVYDAISVYGTEHMLTLAEGVMDMKVPVILVIPTTLSFSFLELSAGGDEEGDDSADGETVAADGNGTPEGADDPESDPSLESEGALDRDALFIGLGDAVMPTIIVASAAYFHSGATDTVTPLITDPILLNLPALTAMVGTIVGLLILLWMVLKGKAHAGLPLLNGGAIGGYLVGALAAGVPLMAALGL